MKQVLATKAVFDFVIILVMTCSMGGGCVFSALPVGAFQGCITALAAFVDPRFVNPRAASNSFPS